MFYGIVHRDQPQQYAQAVCDVLGHGENRLAVRMLLETCAQETHMGRFRDTDFLRHGIGLMQLDRIGFDDVKTRARDEDLQKLEERFGVVIRSDKPTQKAVEHEDLAFSPLLSMIFARLFYKLRPDPIPDSIEGRARYWKKYYNTPAGKGTEAEYLLNAKRFLS